MSIYIVETMKTKLVLWGTKEEHKVLVALELLPKKNVINRWLVPEDTATEDLYKSLMAEWREDKEVAFPENATKDVLELTASSTLIPENVMVEKGDIIQRAQTEWHFVVLSTKLSEQYEDELDNFADRVQAMTEYQQQSWDELKGFWNKVQEQTKDRTLLRNHANNLREKTNQLFTKLKELRAAKDAEFLSEAQSNYDGLETTLKDIEARIADNGNLFQLFEDLKKLQNKFRNAKLTRELRGQIWTRLDSAFKVVKEKRFGPSTTATNSPLDRVNRRFEGLMGAIEKMNRSIKRDKDELFFQNKKIDSVSASQLEMQIRQAKVNMVKERISSKEEKLTEMLKTKIELEEKIENIRIKEAKRAAAQAEKETAKKAREEQRQKAAAEKALAEAEAKAKEAAAVIVETVEEVIVEAETIIEAVQETPVVETIIEAVQSEAPVEAKKVVETPIETKETTDETEA